tara:strand:+ start:31 stop:699 length:669 start_codon:yes stop_codon:yes gene_type:complete
MGQVHLPELDDDQVDEIIKYIEEKNKADPFTVLQKDIFTREGGQYLMTNLSPNFEIALFLCQATGSILLTDNHYRWDEILQAQHKESGITTYEWQDLSKLMDELEYSLNGNIEKTLQHRVSGKLGEIRKVTKEVYLTIRGNNDPDKISSLTEALKKQYELAHNAAERAFDKDDQNTFKAKLSHLIPKGGIVHNNVQRMLLTCGNDNHMRNVPMAILVEHAPQ